MLQSRPGLDVEHPIAGDELRAIKRYAAIRTDALSWLFIFERGLPLTRQSVNYLVVEAAARAGLPPVNPHMLRQIQDYLGRRDPKHTVHYTPRRRRPLRGDLALSPRAFTLGRLNFYRFGAMAFVILDARR